MSIEKINICDKEVEISNAFGWMFKYKAQFGEDPATFLVPAFSSAADGTGSEAMEKIGFVNIANMFWAMAKQAHKEIPDPDTWLSRFDDLTLEKILNVAGDIVTHAVTGMKTEAKNPQGAETAAPEKKNQSE